MDAFFPLYRREDGEDIPIGHIAVADGEDYERLCPYRPWRLHTDGYASKTVNGKTLLMHRIILGVTDTSIHIDHIDHDRLNNRKANLRAGTQGENNANSKPGPRADGSSGFKGVNYHRGRRGNKPWRAHTWWDGKALHIGYFETKQEAVDAYNEWWQEHATEDFHYVSRVASVG